MSLRLCVYLCLCVVGHWPLPVYVLEWKKKTAQRVCILYMYVEVILVSARAKDFFTLNSEGPKHRLPESQPRYLLCALDDGRGLLNTSPAAPVHSLAPA